MDTHVDDGEAQCVAHKSEITAYVRKSDGVYEIPRARTFSSLSFQSPISNFETLRSVDHHS